MPEICIRVFVLVCALACLSFATARAELVTVRNIDAETALVFIHGYMGSAEESFYDEEEETYLYRVLSEDGRTSRRGSSLRETDFYVVEYPADFCTNFTLTELAARVAFDLRDAGIFDRYRFVVLVAHSFGGIVAKKVLLDLDADDRERAAGLIMLGTPSEGALLADAAAYVGAFDDDCTIVRDLRELSYNSILQDIEARWTQLLRSGRPGERPSVHCMYEKEGAFGLGIIVPLERIDRNCETIMGASADHFELAAPRSGSTEYNWLLNAIFQSEMQAALWRNAPQTGIGEVSTRLIAHAWFDYDGDSEVATGQAVSTAREAETIIAEVSLDRVPYCLAEHAGRPKPWALAEGTLYRTGRTEFQLVSSLGTRGTTAASNCLLMKDSRTYRHRRSNAEIVYRLEAAVQVAEPGRTLSIRLERVPRPSITLFDVEGKPLKPIIEIEEPVEEGAAGITGTFEFRQLWKGTYLLLFRSEGRLVQSAETQSEAVRDESKGRVTFAFE